MRKVILAAAIIAGALQAASLTRQEAIDFLYESMSLPDKADYPASFYEANVDASLRARSEMPWGGRVPDREFLHFVVPVRVNNENLDMSRTVFYDELKERVKGLSMRDAILEVNHWCHEKVTYQPSDGRTSSPLSSVSQAIGRCGEESTFTVAALRAVGIPARQIYTPRWAHTDDNHAWVEAWADGEWYFIGACEPEPVLNLAWFNAPASRGLLMSTNVTGHYDGPEEILLREPLTTRINVTSNYAPVDTLRVKVVSADGAPVAGASVYFCIYNYAEFYPAVTKSADKDGNATLTAGMGDLLVWATDGSRFGFAKSRPGESVTVALTNDSASEFATDIDVVPPAPRDSQPMVSAEARMENDRRFAREDSIRNAYISTFCSGGQARDIAARLSLEPEPLTRILTQARGNHAGLTACLEQLDEPRRRAAVALLLNVTEKDLRDIPQAVVADHAGNVTERSKAASWIDDDTYNRYILSPRIENEGLRPWRGYMAAALDSAGVSADPSVLTAWIDNNIAKADGANPLRLRMSPMAVMEQKKADALSRGIFFVAAARTLGIPARIDPVTGAVQYMEADRRWHTVRFKDDASQVSAPTASTGTLRLTFTPQGHINDPKYYSQFSIIRIENGRARQLEYDESGTLASLFSTPAELEAGQYMLVSGQRLANGGVLAHCEIFTIEDGEDVVRELKIRRDDSEVSVIGSLNAENLYHDLTLDTDKSLLSTTGRGYYVLGLITPNHEPSAHALNDISAVARELEATGVKIMLLFDSAESAARFNRGTFDRLPPNVVFGIDNGGASRRDITESLNLGNAADPVFVIADTFNRVVWVSTGYTIGTGEQLLNILHRVQ